jgi:hypothetical protein
LLDHAPTGFGWRDTFGDERLAPIPRHLQVRVRNGGDVMHATVRRYASDHGLVDALVENESEIRDVIGGIDGFRAYYAIRTGDGGAVTISVYDDASGAEASNAAAAGWVRENLPELAAAGPPEVTAGEVAVSL